MDLDKNEKEKKSLIKSAVNEITHVSFAVSWSEFSAAAILGQKQVDKKKKKWAEDYCLSQNAQKIKTENNSENKEKEKAASRCYLHEPLVFCDLHDSEKKKKHNIK